MKIGEILREARKEKGLSLSQVAKEIFIQEKFLQALEEGNFDLIPGEAYQRAFFRTYADYLGLGDYIENLTRPHKFPEKEEEPRMNEIFGGSWDSGRKMRVGVKLAMIVIAVLLISLGVKAAFKPKGETKKPNKVTSTQPLDVVPSNPTQSWNYPDEGDMAKTPEPLKKLEHEIVLTATGECWLTLKTPENASPLFNGTMYKPDVLRFTDVYGFILTAGKPENLIVKFDGEEVPWKLGQTIMNLPETVAVFPQDSSTPSDNSTPPANPTSPDSSSSAGDNPAGDDDMSADDSDAGTN
ncbi:MAG: RodZ domain-containing protein [bacterium]